MLFSSATKIASQQNRIFEMVYLIFEGLCQIFWTVVFVTWDSVFDNHWDPCIFTISINQHQSESITSSQQTESHSGTGMSKILNGLSENWLPGPVVTYNHIKSYCRSLSEPIVEPIVEHP